MRAGRPSMDAAPGSPLTINERAALLALLENDDFKVYLTLLRRKQDAARYLFPELIDSPSQAALYNKQRGFIAGMEVACALCQTLTHE